MSDVKWIKLMTGVFDDDKVLLIENMPDTKPLADSILIIWFKLLCLAGKQNNGGVFVMGNNKPYTTEMLAGIFKRDIKIVEKAFQVFEDFGMIEKIDNVTTLPNWEKHQSLDQFEQAKENTRKRVAKHREKQKLLAQNNAVTQCNADVTLQVTQCNGNRIDKDKNRLEEIKDKKEIKEKEIRHKYGEYSNVLLSDTEFEKLKSEFPSDYTARIESLSSYIASTGKTYKNHLATIRNWARKDTNKPQKTRYGDFDVKTVFDKALERTYAPKMHKSENTKTAANDASVRERMEALKEQIGQG